MNQQSLQLKKQFHKNNINEKNSFLLKCTPKVRQYDILKNKRGAFFMPTGKPNKKYSGKFKEKVIETMQKEKLSYREAARQFKRKDNKIVALERIYIFAFSITISSLFIYFTFHIRNNIL